MMQPLEIVSCSVTGKIAGFRPHGDRHLFSFTIRSERFKSTRICSSFRRSAALFDTGKLIVTAPSLTVAVRYFRGICRKLGANVLEKPKCSNAFVVGDLGAAPIDLEKISNCLAQASFDAAGSRTSRSVVRVGFPKIGASVSVFASGKIQMQTKQMPDLAASTQALSVLRDFAQRSP
jgi:hypothetical protein